MQSGSSGQSEAAHRVVPLDEDHVRERERESEHRGETNAACRHARDMVNCTFNGA